LAVAVWQAVKARRAAEAARDAANRAEKQIGRQVLLTDVSASLRILEEIRTLMRAMRYEPALMRTSDLIGQLTQVRQVKGGTNPLDLGGMLTQLHVLQELLERKMHDPSVVVDPQATKVLSRLSARLNSWMGDHKYTADGGL